MAMIKFQNVTKIYDSRSGPVRALENVSFEISKGEFASIVGKSGSGKTTLLKLLLVEIKPTGGQIFFEDKDINKIKSRKLHLYRREIGTIFQDYRLLPNKTLRENIAYVLEVIGAPASRIAKDVSEVLDLVGLGSRAHHFPTELSGGEKQRAAIARALVHRPQVVLADEPTGNLDPYHTQDISRLLLKINQMGTTIVLATHNREVINSLQKRTIVLEDGKIIKDEAQSPFIMP